MHLLCYYHLTYPTLCSMHLWSGWYRFPGLFQIKSLLIFQTIERLFQIITIIYFRYFKFSYFRWSQCNHIDYGKCRGSEGGWNRLHEWHHWPQCWWHKVSDNQVSWPLTKIQTPRYRWPVVMILPCQADIVARSQFDAGENVRPSVPPLSRWKHNRGRQGSLYPNYAHSIYISIIF